jgi:hypothetical protein
MCKKRNGNTIGEREFPLEIVCQAEPGFLTGEGKSLDFHPHTRNYVEHFEKNIISQRAQSKQRKNI